MSVNIQNGFKFARSELSFIVAEMEALKPCVEELQQQQYLRVYASVLVESMDRARLELESGRTGALISGYPDSLVRDAIAKRRARIRATRERDPDVDLEVTVTCWRSPQLGEVIGCVFSELESHVLRLMTERGVAVDYAYWNGVPPDKDVPAQEWRRREAVWLEVRARKAGMGFQFQFDGEPFNFSRDWRDIAGYVPDVDHRSRELADPVLFSRWYKALPNRDETGGDIWRRHEEFRRLLKRDRALQEQQAEEVARIQSLLLSVEELGQARLVKQLVLPPRDGAI